MRMAPHVLALGNQAAAVGAAALPPASTSALRCAAGSASTSAPGPLQTRSMAVVVEVKDNRVQEALSELNRRREEAGIPEELRKRRYFMNASTQRYERQKRTFVKALTRAVGERVSWLRQENGSPSKYADRSQKR
jgi:ribosomal protein S21